MIVISKNKQYYVNLEKVSVLSFTASMTSIVAFVNDQKIYLATYGTEKEAKEAMEKLINAAYAGTNKYYIV